METQLPSAALFFLVVCIASIYLIASTGEDPVPFFPGLETGQGHVNRANSMGTRKISGEVLMMVMPASQLGGAQDNRHQNSTDARPSQQPRRDADKTKQKCLLANDAFELPGRCANGFKSVKPDIPCNRDLKNVTR